MADIRSSLGYDPETGIFVWLVSPSNSVKRGSIAGSQHPSGYVEIGFGGKVYRAHRIAWFLFYGVWPKEDIDHMDGCKNNNRISNLREANEAQNLWNSKLCTRNKSGVKGVSWYPPTQKWAAQIRKNNVKYFLGYFEDIQEAGKAVMVARANLHGEFANSGVHS